MRFDIVHKSCIFAITDVFSHMIYIYMCMLFVSLDNVEVLNVAI